MSKIYAGNYLDRAEFGFGGSLLKNKGMVGKASRFGFKKTRKGFRAAKSFTGSTIKRIGTSNTLSKGINLASKGLLRAKKWSKT